MEESGARIYHLFKGVRVATSAIEIPEEGKITLTIECQALDYERFIDFFNAG
ncbi:hypothetical protein [Advenella sp. S44]|uniref:hypothetical protein n=1 Tax=Advenella sp. S44 TaxID=1982755 RepID=UPI001374841E|nr:hypothetical protein [Advenella sp. S44]